MTCDEVRPLLAAILDAELGDKQTIAVRDHLEACISCSAVLQDFETIRGDAPAGAFSYPDLWGRIASRLDVDVPRTDVAADVILKELMDEIQRMRLDLQAVRVEIAALRSHIKGRPADTAGRPTALDLPYLPARMADRYRIV